MDAWIRFWTAVWIGSEQLTRRTVRWLCNAKPKPPSAPKKPAEEQPAKDTAKREPEEATGEQAEQPKESAEKGPADAEGSALLRWVGLAIVLGVTKATPYTTVAAVIAAAAWVVTALALGYLATMKPQLEPESTDEDADQEQPEEAPADEQHPSELLPLGHVAVLLASLYTEGSGVHLAALASHLSRTPLMGLPATPWKTADVRALLARHGVRIRPGVRVPPAGGREGVHRDDFPPLPPRPSDPPVVGVVVPGQPNNNNVGNTAPPFRITDDPDHPTRHHVHHNGR
ncbi:hypothetical protein [Streptomyces rubiginosohelvolus]|uniref:Uncharacterized protein n=1 Tax=Streptomyces rubiginosohelvolus TaxID=67362 RepID=A0ABQ3BN92_9ACTN|nr:hypothetical protein [Streptomyces pluricolorescens]GGZ51649.1 hypothetical protein GCM10010328_27890 [Streptomyces pluricolorescens]